jgi:hypothetical protein
MKTLLSIILLLLAPSLVFAQTTAATTPTTPAAPAATTVALTNAAAFVSQSIPTMMVAGQTYTVSVTYMNAGTATWTNAGNYHLGSQDPQDNTTWTMPDGGGRVLLPTGTSVAPGKSVTFTFAVIAPVKTGSTLMQFRIVQDGVAWFGDQSPAIPVTVLSAASEAIAVPSAASLVPVTIPAGYVPPGMPSPMPTGSVITVSVTWVEVSNGTALVPTGSPLESYSWLLPTGQELP